MTGRGAADPGTDVATVNRMPGFHPRTAAPRTGRFCGVLIALCMLGVACLLGLRVLRYAPFELPAVVDALLGSLLTVAAFGFILPLVAGLPQLVLLAAVVLAACLRPRLALARTQRPWQLRPWLIALLWIECGLNHHLLDVNPAIAALGALSLVANELKRVHRGGPGVAAALFGACAVGAAGALLAQTWADGIAVAAMALLAAAVLWRGDATAGTHEQRLLLVAAAVGCQLLASLLPLATGGPDGAVRIGSGMAYSFCESPDGRSLYAAVPATPTMPQWLPGSAHGAGGHVAEYDAATLAERTRHRFFDASLHGRIEYLLCLRDRVEVGLTNVTIDGRHDQDHAVAFATDGSGRFQRDLLGGGAGHGMVADPRRGATYYVSENKPIIVRVDGDGSRRSQRVRPEGKAGALVVGPLSVHPGRDRLYFAGWLNDRYAYELDPARFAVSRTFAHRNGGALGIAVDAELDRLYTVGIWGMEVFDLATGRLIRRHRLGLLSRSPAIDTGNDLVFVPSTVEGKMRIFDRRTLELLDVLAIGHGARIPLYSPARHRVYGGTSRAHHYWDTDAVAASLRGAGG